MRKVTDKQKANLKPFVKGDPRINRKGRPKSFDQLRELFQSLANEEIEHEGKMISRAAFIGLMMSNDKKLMREFLEFAYGKVPLSQIVDITSGGKPLSWREFINGDGSTEADSDKE